MLLTTAQINVCHKLDEIKDLEVKFMEKQLELGNPTLINLPKHATQRF